ncbi:cupin domain-containing protein [Mycobacterium deserti]|uniref:Cupin domain-containing protein n=1 Tax=Mycobacterium deserti TaxID=2978347 RepID=A0ABT2MEM0_9MYCO|nr:cupin domain-containing protein [Mycobacterium deserti]MCT7660726.1 cupin domain-containing protein [Mycobacterium deserti]
MSRLESAMMLASHIGEGGCGPQLHYHTVDQVYYMMSGSMNVRLGDQIHQVGPGSLVFIPAGTAHCNWNDGPGSETHFEIIVPAPSPVEPIVYFVDSPADVPADFRARQSGYVLARQDAETSEPMPGFRMTPLAAPVTGSDHIVISVAEIEPGKSGPGTHIHEFDQYYLVLEGELTVEVALQRHVVGPQTLVILPAGVPHRQWNEGNTIETHLAILAPVPEEGRPWDVGVRFEVNGESHDGLPIRSAVESTK